MFGSKPPIVTPNATVSRKVLRLIAPAILLVASAAVAWGQATRPGATQPAEQAAPTGTASPTAKSPPPTSQGYQLHKDTVGILLIAYSIVLVALLAERSISWVGLRSASAAAARKTRELVAKMPPREKLAEEFGKMNAPIGRVMGYVLKHDVTNSPEATQLLLEDALDNARRRLRRSHVFLSAIAGTAPFLGLLGTVRGIMNTFTSIMEQGFGGPAVISAGIAEALQTTAVGLMIAIPAFIALKVFAKMADDKVLDLRSQATRIFVALGDF